MSTVIYDGVHPTGERPYDVAHLISAVTFVFLVLVPLNGGISIGESCATNFLYVGRSSVAPTQMGGRTFWLGDRLNHRMALGLV